MTLYRHLVSKILYKEGITHAYAELIFKKQWIMSITHTNMDLLNKSTFEVIAK